jgi:hypothetical protein
MNLIRAKIHLFRQGRDISLEAGITIQHPTLYKNESLPKVSFLAPTGATNFEAPVKSQAALDLTSLDDFDLEFGWTRI